MIFRVSILLIASVTFLIPGCGPPPDELKQEKQIHEKVTDREFQLLISVIEALPEKKITRFPDVFLAVPQWNPERTLPVNELIDEESRNLDEKWQLDYLLTQIKKDRTLSRVLRKKRMKPEEFIGLVLTIGTAFSLSMVDDEQDLEKIVKRGDSIVASIKKDSRTFSSLDEAQRQTVLRKAIWITRMHRAEKMLEVPPENLSLVKENREMLEKIFPRQFLENPLDSAKDILEERGLPFVEVRETGFDEVLMWEHEEAIVGNDPPDKIDVENR